MNWKLLEEKLIGLISKSKILGTWYLIINGMPSGVTFYIFFVKGVLELVEKWCHIRKKYKNFYKKIKKSLSI